MAHYNFSVHPTCAWAFGDLRIEVDDDDRAPHMCVGVWPTKPTNSYGEPCTPHVRGRLE